MWSVDWSVEAYSRCTCKPWLENGLDNTVHLQKQTVEKALAHDMFNTRHQGPASRHRRARHLAAPRSKTKNVVVKPARSDRLFPAAKLNQGIVLTSEHYVLLGRVLKGTEDNFVAPGGRLVEIVRYKRYMAMRLHNLGSRRAFLKIEILDPVRRIGRIGNP